MNVVFNATNFNSLHLVLPRDAAEERPEPVTQFRGDERTAFPGAKNTMEIGADVGHGIYSAVPAGLWQFQNYSRR